MSKQLLELYEEYQYIDETIDRMVAILLSKRDRLFELAMQIKVMVEEEKINQTHDEECENTGCVAGGESANKFKPLGGCIIWQKKQTN